MYDMMWQNMREGLWFAWNANDSLIVCLFLLFCIIYLLSLAAARALMSVDHMTAEEVATMAMNIASNMCVHTNKEFITHSLVDTSSDKDEDEKK